MRISEAIDRFTALFRSSPPGPRASNSGTFNNGFFGRFGIGYQSANTAGVNVNERSALALPAFFAGVNVISSSLASLPLELVQVMPDGSIRKAKEHRCWPIFSRSPDSQTTSMRWRSAITSHAIVYGGGFAEIVPAVDSSRIYLFLLDPASTQVQVSTDGEVSYTTAGGTLPKDKIVHFAGLSHDGITGHPIVRLARQALGLGLAAQEFGGAYLGNGTGAAGWFQPPNELRAEAKKEFLDSVEERHQGPEMAGRMGILPPGWNFLESKGGANPENAQLLGLREFSVQDISRLLNVPPSKLGLRSGESYASLEASQRDFVDSCLVPWGEAFEQSLSLRLLTDEEVADGYQFRHSFDALIRGDTAARTARNSAMFDRGCLQPDEWRVSENLQPLNTPGSRTTYTPLNMTPISGDAQKDSADGQ
jgi:HK97 family phage portal protein